MDKLNFLVGVVGAGSMGGAIASGLVASGAAGPSGVMAADPSETSRAALGELGIRTFSDAAEMVSAGPDVVVLAVKPQILPGVLAGLADLLAGRPQLYVMGADAHSREFTEDARAAIAARSVTPSS